MTKFLKHAEKFSWLQSTFLAILIARPTLDIWRDFSLFTIQRHSVNLTALLALLTAATSIIIIYRERAVFKFNTLGGALLLFVGYAVLSTLYSFNRIDTIIETLKLLDLVLVFFAGFALYKSHPTIVAAAPKLLLASAAIPLLLAVYQWLNKSGLTIDQTENRVYGTFAHPNILAIFSLIVLLGVAYWHQHKKTNDHNPAMRLAVPALLFVIFATYTRVIWLALLGYIILNTFFTHKKLFYKLALAGALMLTVIGSVYFALPQPYKNTVNSIPVVRRIVYRPENADSVQWRFWVIRDSIKIAAMHPIIGFGYGTFPTVWDTYKDPVRRGDPSNEAHNDYLRVLVEGGLVGLVLYLTIFALLIKTALQKKSHIFLVSILLYCGIALSENLLHHTAPAWWLWTLWGMWSAENT